MLIINQGKQDTSKDNSFELIEEADVTAVIEGLELHKTFTDTINVKFRLLSGLHKNRVVFDSVSYNPDSNMSWKYRSLRQCAGVPYQESEPAQIDIEALLKGKVVVLDLSKRTYKDKEGKDKEAQQVAYKKALGAPAMEEAPEQADPFNEDDLPFDKAEEVVAAPSPKAAPKATATVEPAVEEVKPAAKAVEIPEEPVASGYVPDDADDWD